MIKENVEIVGGVEIADDIQHRIMTTGVRGLDYEKARELGVFQRISNLLCVAHVSIMAAYRVYGGVDYLIDQLHARKNEIAKEMNKFDKAFDRFVKFWTDYYSSGKSGKEVNFEVENLYHHIMGWMQMPETWQLGEPQRTEFAEDLAIKIDIPNDKVLTFYKAEMDNEIKECKEQWGVLCYNTQTNEQRVVNTNMDKSSAFMVAKRLSDENKDNIYTACNIRDVIESKTEIVPYKAYKANETIGKITNVK